MDSNLLSLESDIQNYNKVKEIVINKLIDEGYLSKEEGEEFCERAQVIIYKGKWYSRWFDSNVKTENNSDASYYLKIVDFKDKETNLDDLIRRTANGK